MERVALCLAGALMLFPIPNPATTKRDVALTVWGSYLHQPYKWGGDNPLEGVDCSGLVLEGLRSVGLVPREVDYTAHDLLHQVYKTAGRLQDAQLLRGALVFWSVDGKADSKIRHVEIVWTRADGDVLTIGASGGGSRTTDRAAAIRDSAYVKIRRITPGWVAAVDPFGGR